MPQPVPVGDIDHQTEATLGAAAGMARIAGHDGQKLLLDATALAVNLKIQLPAQAEHQLRVLMAVDDLVVAVMTQGKDGRQGRPRLHAERRQIAMGDDPLTRAGPGGAT